jgi:hypothetical protein
MYRVFALCFLLRGHQFRFWSGGSGVLTVHRQRIIFLKVGRRVKPASQSNVKGAVACNPKEATRFAQAYIDLANKSLKEWRRFLRSSINSLADDYGTSDTVASNGHMGDIHLVPATFTPQP